MATNGDNRPAKRPRVDEEDSDEDDFDKPFCILPPEANKITAFALSQLQSQQQFAAYCLQGNNSVYQAPSRTKETGKETMLRMQLENMRREKDKIAHESFRKITEQEKKYKEQLNKTVEEKRQLQEQLEYVEQERRLLAFKVPRPEREVNGNNGASQTNNKSFSAIPTKKIDLNGTSGFSIKHQFRPRHNTSVFKHLSTSREDSFAHISSQASQTSVVVGLSQPIPQKVDGFAVPQIPIRVSVPTPVSSQASRSPMNEPRTSGWVQAEMDIGRWTIEPHIQETALNLRLQAELERPEHHFSIGRVPSTFINGCSKTLLLSKNMPVKNERKFW